MNARRIVAARVNGRSTVVEDAAIPQNPFHAVPGFDATVVWGTGAKPSLSWPGTASTPHPSSVLPGTGETRLLIVTFPPDSAMAHPRFDPVAAGKEYAEKLPGLAELFEQDCPGMHTTTTIDYDVVLEGSLTVEFDDGRMVDISAGDVVVQHGTRHAWRNRGTKPAKMLFVLIGAEAIR
jgi:mannose-6-phosphate isomerase-like protein (cupin superfamily)